MHTYFIRVYPQKTEIKPIAIYIKIRFASHFRRVRLAPESIRFAATTVPSRAMTMTNDMCALCATIINALS